MAGTVHVIGAGLSGLSAAMHLVKAGYRVELHERSGMAGGRCRSFEDKRLGCLIDNGNHLMMSGNHAVLELLDLAGARGNLLIGELASYRFYDATSGERWSISLDDGPLPFWLFDRQRRVPGTRLSEYLSLLRVLYARRNESLGTCLRRGPLYDRFWEPLVLAVMNLPVAEADAGLLRRVLLETMVRGGRYSRPMIARHGLGPDLIEPFAAWLQGQGAGIRYHRLLRSLERQGSWIAALQFGDSERLELGAQDRVVLAVPPEPAAALMPWADFPEEGEPILNIHFSLPDYRSDTEGSFPVIGMVGTVSHWLFLRDGVASVTVSAARNYASGGDDEALAARIWAEVSAAAGIDHEGVPPHRIIREKRATFIQTPLNVARRPSAATALGNLWLAGDWTDTGLPATIESSVRSGKAAALAVTQAAAV
jgi:hydroxysqualene dehydroxylase